MSKLKENPIPNGFATQKDAREAIMKELKGKFLIHAGKKYFIGDYNKDSESVKLLDSKNQLVDIVSYYWVISFFH